MILIDSLIPFFASLSPSLFFLLSADQQLSVFHSWQRPGSKVRARREPILGPTLGPPVSSIPLQPVVLLALVMVPQRDPRLPIDNGLSDCAHSGTAACVALSSLRPTLERGQDMLTRCDCRVAHSSGFFGEVGFGLLAVMFNLRTHAAPYD